MESEVSVYRFIILLYTGPYSVYPDTRIKHEVSKMAGNIFIPLTIFPNTVLQLFIVAIFNLFASGNAELQYAINNTSNVD